MNKGMSLRQVEAIIKVQSARLSDYERGISEPRVSRAIVLAKFYGSTVEELFSDF